MLHGIHSFVRLAVRFPLLGKSEGAAETSPENLERQSLNQRLLEMPRKNAHGEHRKNLFRFVEFVLFVAICISQNLAEITRKLGIVITEKDAQRSPRALFHAMADGFCVRFCRSMVLLTMAAPSIGPVTAAGIEIKLKDQAAVQSEQIFLKDVADLSGDVSDQLNRVAEIPLGPSPEFGAAVVMNRHQILECIRKAGGPATEVGLTGAAAVQVRLQGRPPDPGEIEPMLKAYLLEKTSWKASEIESFSIRGLNGIELPPRPVDFRFASDPNFTGGRKILFPIEAVKAGRAVRSFWISAEVSVRASILTASKKIPFKKTITSDDIREASTEIPDLRAVYARDPGDLVGRVSRRGFSPGDPLALDAFSEPLLIRHGETVRLRLERNGIVLQLLARAEQDGKLGQVIKVRNLDFSSIVNAEVTGRASVKIP